MAAALEEAMGTVCWWGISPAMDLRQHLPAELDPAAEAAVLLVGAAEGRHLLMTAARARREPSRSVTLFVAEHNPESVARQLLFLLLALECPDRPRAEARAATMLELLGSGSLRAATAEVLRGAAGRLRRWVTGERRGFVDLSLMKCRDRDALEAVLRRWERALPVPGATPAPGQSPGQSPGAELSPELSPDRPPGPPGWDWRLRRRLGARYESRAAVADWELRMALQPRGATSLSPAEFSRWRQSGDAFGGGGDIANATLLSERHPRADGRMTLPPGYWGDVAIGPFVSFGLQREGRGKTATEISQEFLTSLLDELLTPNSGSKPQNSGQNPKNWDPHPKKGDEDPKIWDKTPKNWDKNPKIGDQFSPKTQSWDDSDPLGPLAPLPIPIRFLPLLSSSGIPKIPKMPQNRLGGLCQLLVLGWRSLPLTAQLGSLAAPGATLLLELPTLVPSLGAEQQGALRRQASGLAGQGGFGEGKGEIWGHLGFVKQPAN